MSESAVQVNTQPANSRHGIWAPALTPLDEEGSIDTSRLVRHCRQLLQNGCHGIVLFGTTGEAPSFAVDERRRALDQILESGAVTPCQLIVGAGVCALTESVALIRHALDQGCTGALVMPPFFFRGVSETGVAEYYRRLVDESSMGDRSLLFYHFPQMSGVPVTAAIIDMVMTHAPHVVGGIKDSSGEIQNTLALLQNFPHMDVFPGSELLMRDAMARGAAGCITATANCNPGGIRAVYDQLTSGDDDDSGAAHDRMCDIRRAFQGYSHASGGKSVLAKRYRDDGWRRVRLPLEALNEQQSLDLLNSVRAAGLDV